ncbi:WD40/YVTN/BNR-like repeat-containing protein [Flagellimonas iocasae]|uniref:WD40/YVTN/BNR-like repeat-containing protein n=1 Tax=Flagellimonas iocasae TaxID=2055905 RepID=A0ABW4XWD1_9FLAO
MKYTFPLCILLALCLSVHTTAQQNSESLTTDLRWRNIGPANMMGRIAAVEALNTDYRTVLVASASGGVFKSTNAGITWTPIFDDYGAGSIGAVAFFQPNPDIIWVGTGESANRNSSAYGDGIYKSTDGGKTFQNMGLETTHQIAEIATHPTNPDIAYVAAVGHLWGYSGERGLFKTTDGGKTWEKLTNGLPTAVSSGCTEIIMHPENPDVLFAGFYERLRQPASFKSGGPNGGLFKSEDGGKSWRKITNGLAEGESGMIDVSIHLKNPDIMVMAYEADENIPEGKPGSGVYRSDDGGESWKFLLKHAVRPFYHGQIQIDPLDDDLIYVVSRGFMISRDGGKSFQPPRWRADGGDDHDMWIAPYDSKIMYMATDQGARLTIDGGQNFLSFNNMAIGQYYAVGVDMRKPYWVIGGLQDNGLWMGPSNSRERRGILNEHNTWVAEGDGFHAQIDPTDWRTIYTVNHVGFVARQNVETREYAFITPTPETVVNFKDYFDPNYPETHNWYSIYPGERWFFREDPERPLLPPQFRFNWSTPFIISPNHPQTVYFGSNHLFRSTDRGDSWRIISPDLTTNDPKLRNTSKGGGLTNSNTGGENHFTIMTISESPLNDQVVWVGTDDGNVQVTRNGGESWTNVKKNFPGIPEKIWVSRVEASHHVEGRVYVTFDNHRFDDNKPYVFVSDDFGKNWKDISSNLPEKYSVYVIKEDPEQEGLLYLGSEESVYTSLDNGKSWINMRNNLPTVAIYDLVVHPRDGDLIAGTHGRSIWIMDDLSPLRQMSAEVAKKQLHLFKPKEATKWITIDTGRKQPAFEFRGENPPSGAIVNFYVGQQTSDSATIAVKTLQGEKVFEQKIAVHQGINRTIWPLSGRGMERFYPVSQETMYTYKTHLQWVINELKNRVKKKELIAGLKPISDKLAKAATIDELNAVRSDLVTGYASYAGGETFFGPKPKFSIDEGNYIVSIALGGETVEESIEVENDPLIEE